MVIEISNVPEESELKEQQSPVIHEVTFQNDTQNHKAVLRSPASLKSAYREYMKQSKGVLRKDVALGESRIERMSDSYSQQTEVMEDEKNG